MGKRWKKGQGSSVYPVGDDEAQLRLRHKFLLQDYKQLRMETEAKKKTLMISTKKKLRLQAEIKFLQRKLKSFLENPSQTKPFKLKIRYSDDLLSSLPSPMLEVPANLKEYSIDEIQEERDSQNAIIPQMVDLNQIYLTYNDDDANEPMESNKPPDVYLINGKREISVKDAKLLKCRDAKNGANRVKWRNPVVSIVHHLPLH